MKRRKKSGRYTFFLVALIVVMGVIVISTFTQSSKEKSSPSQTYTVEDNGQVTIEAKSVIKRIDGRRLELFTYNGQFPGPLLRVKQKSNIVVDFLNNLDQETTIHWHGLRHNYKFDGVPDISQPPVKPGQTFRYELFFPDAGVFWYHPHIREDIQQERGMYGMIIVEPETEESIPREVPMILDDMLLTENNFYPFSDKFTNFALMGRFGNVLLVNGETEYTLQVKKGETIRLYLLNAANVRPFNFSIERTQLRVMGSDLSAYEKPFMTESIIIAPAERYSVDVSFDTAGIYQIRNSNPDASYDMGKIIVEGEVPTMTTSLPETDIANYKQYITQAPDFEFSLNIDMRGMVMGNMHQSKEPLEWEDTMFMMNQMHNNLMMSWFIEDNKTKKRNMDIMAQVKQGDVKVLRITNEKDSQHPMQHPIHLHGQRFLVVRQDGVENKNLVWKDTVLIPKGSTVDLLVDFSNPGVWMMHCHIAEHLHSGMMTSFTVEEVA